MSPEDRLRQRALALRAPGVTKRTFKKPDAELDEEAADLITSLRTALASAESAIAFMQEQHTSICDGINMQHAEDMRLVKTERDAALLRATEAEKALRSVPDHWYEGFKVYWQMTDTKRTNEECWRAALNEILSRIAKEKPHG